MLVGDRVFVGGCPGGCCRGSVAKLMVDSCCRNWWSIVGWWAGW